MADCQNEGTYHREMACETKGAGRAGSHEASQLAGKPEAAAWSGELCGISWQLKTQA